MKSLLIIPTYNEAENIHMVLERVVKASPLSHVLVVDDTSPDGTADKVRAFAEHLPQIHLLLRKNKEGLAKAYLAGFQWGLENNYDSFIQMDADLSHDPLDVPRLLKELETVDCAVGSRYIKGGGTEGWTIPRQMISHGGNLYAKWILGVNYEDLTGGFNAWRRKALEEIGLSTIGSRGYAFQVEMKYRAHRAGLKIIEIPILFRNRIHGVSKMSGQIITEAAWRVLKLRFT